MLESTKTVASGEQGGGAGVNTNDVRVGGFHHVLAFRRNSSVGLAMLMPPQPYSIGFACLAVRAWSNIGSFPGVALSKVFETRVESAGICP